MDEAAAGFDGHADVLEEATRARNHVAMANNSFRRYSIRTLLAFLVLASLVAFATTTLFRRPAPPTLPERADIVRITIENRDVPPAGWDELLAALRLEKPADQEFESAVVVAQGSLDIHRKGTSRLTVFLDFDDQGRVFVTLFDAETRTTSISLAAAPDRLARALDHAFDRAWRPQPKE